MNTEKIPYELLVRFDQNGAVAGAHVIWAYKVSDGDKVVSYQPGQAERAGEAISGFPLSAAVSEALAEGLKKAAAVLEENEALKSSLRAKEASIEQLEQELVSARSAASTSRRVPILGQTDDR